MRAQSQPFSDDFARERFRAPLQGAGVMKVGILGAGIAGLAVAWLLGDGAEVWVHEASGAIGGLARSFKWHGFDCDLAPHRFFTRDEELLRQVLALVPMRRVKRRSSIRLRGQWLRDPVNIFEVLFKFMPVESALILWHYLLRSKQPEDSFEALVLNNYGKGLNHLFFKPYSEKLFGIPASEISPSWGRRKIRISGFRDLVRRDPRLYFEHFYYPAENGYGAIADRLYADVRPRVRLHSRVVGLTRLASGGYEGRFETPTGITTDTFDMVVSTLPMPELGALLGLQIPLRFRPMTLLYLLVGVDQVSDRHWSYFADRDVIVNRVAEFKHFSGNGPSGTTVICCEVTDAGQFSIDRVLDQLTRAEFLPADAPILDTKIIHLERAYPIYDLAYDEQIESARQAFAAHPRIFHIGRQAQFVHKDVDEILEEAKTVADLIRPGSGRWRNAAPSLDS
jgi:protoporphyrinogen oxidase